MRRLVLSVYALVLVNELGQAAIVPLLPTLGRKLSLSEVETGAILAATTFATVLVAIPIGMLTDRIGARRLSVAAAVLIGVSALIQVFASSFAVLVAGRALFGIAFATVWTAGIMLVSSATSTRRAAAVGGTVTVGGVAHLIGPTSSGFLAEHGGVALPFLVIAGAAALVALLLATGPCAPRPPAQERSLRGAVAAIRGHTELRSAVVVMALIGVVAGLIPLLVPLILDENGLSPGEIGAVFSAGAAVWILASAFVARLGARAVRVPAAGVGVLALGAVLLLPVATLATAGLAVFLMLVAATRGPLSTISYPLAEAGARIAGIGAGTAIGLLNVVWGLAAGVGPLVGGAVADGIGPRPTFALMALCAAVAGASILLTVRRDRTRAQPMEATH